MRFNYDEDGPKCTGATYTNVPEPTSYPQVFWPQITETRWHLDLLPISNQSDNAAFLYCADPYARLVSAWADKFQNKSLVSGDWFVDHYLTYRRIFDQSLPEGPEHTLRFLNSCNLRRPPPTIALTRTGFCRTIFSTC